MPNPAYLAWKSANRPCPESVSSEKSAATSSSITSPVYIGSYSSHKSSEELLYELLTLPQPPSISSRQPKRKTVNDKALEIADNVL